MVGENDQRILAALSFASSSFELFFSFDRPDDNFRRGDPTMKPDLLGTTRATEGWKTGPIEEVRKELDGGDVGDFIAYRKKDGDVVLEILE